MENQGPRSTKSDTLFFAKENGNTDVLKKNKSNFKLLIVDDENEIHAMTKLVLDDYEYMDQGIEFLSAFSGKEAKELIQTNDDIACCLLDVVMETKDAGLEVARFIREEANNSKMRIILRTGQPGKAPEKDIILNYDINDYKEKTELTTQKLFTTVTTALRSYIHLLELEEKNREIKSKNIRLNEEIARRIVAESNLTKYNRSLERMIESKTQRLKTALKSLKKTERQLFITQKAAIVSDVSSISLNTFDTSNAQLEQNLRKMNSYRQQITFLLEKYNTLETIITVQHGNNQKIETEALKSLEEIKCFKLESDMDRILERYPKIIEDSLRGIKQISNAITDVKLFIAINDEVWRPTDINAILKGISTHSPNKKKNIDIQFDLQDLPIVLLPEKNIIKAIYAVADNAIKAVTHQGIISIVSRYEDPNIVVAVCDIGIGVPEDQLPKVFTPYFSGWPSKEKGLGLSFAKSVLLNCGGDISITSTEKEGTTVTLCLPGDTSE